MEPSVFSHETGVRFALPSPARVTAEVHDLRGRRVRVIDLGVTPAGSGRVSWNGRDEAGRRLPGGVYVLTIRADRWRDTARVVLVR